MLVAHPISLFTLVVLVLQTADFQTYVPYYLDRDHVDYLLNLDEPQKFIKVSQGLKQGQELIKSRFRINPRSGVRLRSGGARVSLQAKYGVKCQNLIQGS